MPEYTKRFWLAVKHRTASQLAVQVDCVIIRQFWHPRLGGRKRTDLYIKKLKLAVVLSTKEGRKTRKIYMMKRLSYYIISYYIENFMIDATWRAAGWHCAFGNIPAGPSNIIEFGAILYPKSCCFVFFLEIGGVWKENSLSKLNSIRFECWTLSRGSAMTDTQPNPQ